VINVKKIVNTKCKTTTNSAKTFLEMILKDSSHVCIFMIFIVIALLGSYCNVVQVRTLKKQEERRR
jgi:hypothetical protein